VSNAFPLNSDHTLATTIANVLPQPENGYLLAVQNPIPVAAGTPFGTAFFNWSTTTATAVEIHVGAPDGPKFAWGGPQGSATASGWVTDGMVFYLQDVSNGEPLTSQFTIATQTIHFIPAQPAASFQANPDPILVPAGTQFGSTTLYWSAPAGAVLVEVHIGAPDGPLVASGPAVGS